MITYVLVVVVGCFVFWSHVLEDGPTVYKLDYLQMDYIKCRDIKKNYISNLSYIP